MNRPTRPLVRGPVHPRSHLSLDPPSPGRHRSEPGVGVMDAASDARASAVVAINVGSASYAAANNQLETDSDDYYAALNEWNRVNGSMPDDVYLRCIGNLNQAATAFNDEATNVAAGYGHLMAADTQLAAGDAANNPMEKVGKYNNAKSHGDAAEDCGSDALDASSQTLVPKLAAAWTDLENYG